MGGWFILTLKRYSNSEGKAKVRFVAQCFDDRDKQFSVYNTSIIKPSSNRMILPVAAQRKLSIFSHDVT